MISRRRTREYLLQLLYARSCVSPTFDRDAFLKAYFTDMDQSHIDAPYIDEMESLIMAHEAELLSIIAQLAPKFELQTMPIMHILILMIALTESLYLRMDTIPLAISINEAIELTKRFSDESGKLFVNGALSTFSEKKDSIVLGGKLEEFKVFASV